MNEPTHVAEIRVSTPPGIHAEWLRDVLIRALVSCGMTEHEDFELHFHPVAEIAAWRKLTQNDLPSPKQARFLNILIHDLDLQLRLATGNKFPDSELARPRALLEAAQQIIASGEITRRRTSEIIDAVKEALADVLFVTTGRVEPTE